VGEARAPLFSRCEEGQIQLSHTLDELIGSEVSESEGLRRPSDARGFLGMVEDIEDSRGQRLRIFWGDEPPGLPMANELGRAPDRSRASSRPTMSVERKRSSLSPAVNRMTCREGPPMFNRERTRAMRIGA